MQIEVSIFSVFAWFCLEVTQRSGIKLGGLAAYIYSVANQN